MMFFFLLVVAGCGATYHNVSTGGAVYTRWGHTECNLNAALVYSGYTAGAHYAHPGGQSNPMCLPTNPQHSENQPQSTYSGYIYGSEYQTQFRRDQDVPCAVCQSHSAQHVLMIPGYKQCPERWNLEYRGYIMGGFYGHRNSHESVCMDKEMKSLPGGTDNKNGLLWYFILTKCGSLKCPPYVHEKIIPCVVCST